MYMSTEISNKLFNISGVKIFIRDAIYGKTTSSRSLLAHKINEFSDIDVDFTFQSVSEARAFVDVIESAISQFENDS